MIETKCDHCDRGYNSADGKLVRCHRCGGRGYFGCRHTDYHRCDGCDCRVHGEPAPDHLCTTCRVRRPDKIIGLDFGDTGGAACCVKSPIVLAEAAANIRLAGGRDITIDLRIDGGRLWRTVTIRADGSLSVQDVAQQISPTFDADGNENGGTVSPRWEGFEPVTHDVPAPPPPRPGAGDYDY